jgi:hypothetical protein
VKGLLAGFVLAVLIVPGPSFGAWISNGTILTNVAWNQYAPEMIPDGAGGAIVVWSDSRSAIGFDIYAQRVNANGVALWTPNGVPICTAADYQTFPVITSDGAGGAIMAWVDFRPGSGGVYVRRINAAGTVQWTADGVGLATHGAGVDALQIVTDGAGGAIVTWVDNRNNPNRDIYARRVNSAGVAQWAVNGVAICTAAGDPDMPDIVSDLSGGAIITWGDYRTSPTNADIYAQRVNSAGAVQWAADGVAVCTVTGNQVNPRTAPDGSGGVIAGWWDARGISADIYAQRLNGSGVSQWTSNGVLLCDATDSQLFPQLASDGAGGAIAVWTDYRNGPKTDVYGQRINASGAALWASNGVLVFGAFDNQYVSAIVPDGNGGAVLTCDDWRNGGTNLTDVYAQRLDAYGAAQWAADGVGVSVGPGYQADMKIAVDGTGAIVFTWDDARSGYDKIYAQRLESTYGYWGHPEPTITAVADIPHDQGGKVAINWTSSSRDLPTPQTISFYSIWRAVSAIPVGSASIGLKDLRDLKPAFAEPVYLSTPPGHYYEQVGTQAAHAWPGYSFSASTRADSVAGATANTFFMIAAHDQYNDFIAFPSNEVSGHSVDNLAPAAPLLLTAQRVGADVNLRWNRAVAPDLRDYSVYRQTASGVTPVPINFLTSSEDTIAVDPNAPTSALYYIVTAYDVHANQSAPSNEASVQALTGIGNTPAITALTVLQNQPNPFAATTDLRVGLPAASDLSIEVFDVAGRRVRTQALARQSAGWRSIPFDGRDDGGHRLASGVYFYRVTANGKTVTNKMVIAR